MSVPRKSLRGRPCPLLVLSVVTLATSARLRVASQAGISSNHELVVADPGEIAATLQAKAKSWLEEPGGETPFQCQSHLKGVALLAEKPLVLHDVGKLAKGGNFLVSDDKRVLVKHVASVESTVLSSWTEKGIMTHNYDDCETFEKSLILPVPLTFYANKPYIVMFNKTAQLEDLAGSHWKVKTSYDIKPLPNLSKGLIQILKAFMEGWGKDLPKLNEWLGWKDVEQLLFRDVNALKESNVVDYSFFVHVILPSESATAPSPSGLSSSNGCIQEPTGKAIVCFNILDFLTGLTTKRQLESSWKAGKFDEYAGKLWWAFECFGDLSAHNCKTYQEYLSIKTAANKAEAKVAFVATSSFRETYECKVDEPYLALEDRDGVLNEVLWGYTRPGEFEEDDSYEVGSYASSVAKYLSEAVSLDEGAEIVRDDYKGYMDFEFDGSKSYQCALNQTAMIDASSSLKVCKERVYDFATLSRGLLRNQRIHEDLGNVIWNPELKSIVVVRGAPQYVKFLYSHSGIVADMLREMCVMKARFFHCRQIPGNKGAMYDYQLSFKDLEILQVFPGHINEEEFTSHGEDFFDARESE